MKSKYENRFTVGEKFGFLKILDSKIEMKNEAMVKVKCECGTIKLIGAHYLVNNKIKSCGCKMNLSGENHGNWLGGNQFLPVSRYNKMKTYSTDRNGRFLFWDISIEYLNSLIENQKYKCALSRIKLDRDISSLDRINSTKGYIEGNVQWVHKDINIMKNSYDESYFLFLCNLIARHNPVDLIKLRLKSRHKTLHSNTVIYEILSSDNKIYKILGPCGLDFFKVYNKKHGLDKWHGISWHAITRNKKENSKGWKLIKTYQIPKDLLIQSEYQLEKCQKILLENLL